MGVLEQPSDEEKRNIQNEEPFPLKGSHDGDGAADHDQPYTFNRKPTVDAPFPFTPRQFAKLLVARGAVQQRADGSDHPNIKRFQQKAEGK